MTQRMFDLKAEHQQRFMAFLFCAALLLFLVTIGLLVPILTGLLAYILVHKISERVLGSVAPRRRARALAAGLLAIVVGAVLLAAGIALHVLLHDGAGFHGMLERMAQIVTSARASLPFDMGDRVPQTDAMLQFVGDWLNQHAAEVGTISLEAIKDLGYALIGLLLGMLIAVAELDAAPLQGHVTRLLADQLSTLRDMFWSVANAQVRISLVNTTLTGIYLLIVLPAAGVHLPFTKTMVTLTFFAGLLPIIGNLISNSTITVIGMGYSVTVGLCSLMFLIGVHKLEYFLNARIVGGRINARTWEILVCMVIFESLFGLKGVVLAPILYAWLKAEWQRWDAVPSGA